jgi:hypothetical protein
MKITFLERSEKLEAKRIEKERNFLIEQTKHMQNGSNVASFYLHAKKILHNGLTLIEELLQAVFLDYT